MSSSNSFFTNEAALYTMGFGIRPENVEIPHIDTRAPSTTDVAYPVGKRWINNSSNTEYALTSLSTSNGVISATWTLLGAGEGDLNTLTTADSTVVTPTSGNINLSGSGSITTVGSGSTATVELTGLTAHDVLVGAGTSTITKVSPSTSGYVLTSNGTSSDPSFQNVGVNALTVDGDSGSASPSSGTITISGGTTGLTTSGTSATLDLTGTLIVGNGGTGATTLTSHGVLVGAGTSAISGLTVGTNGQVLLGSTGANPAFGTLTSSTGIAFTTGAGSLAVNITGGGMKSNSVATASATGATQNSYICSDSAQTTVSLPSTSSLGDMFLICGTSANTGGWIVSQASGQEIFSGSNHTTSGATGYIATAAANTSALLICTAANTTWIAIATVGTVTYN